MRVIGSARSRWSEVARSVPLSLRSRPHLSTRGTNGRGTPPDHEPAAPVQTESKQEIGTADARGCTRMDRASANAGGHKVYFGARLAKAEQHAKATRLEVIDGLRSVYAVQCLHGLQCNDDGIIGRYIGGVLLGDDSGFKNVRSYCELCWPRPHSTCRTVAAASAVSRPDPQGRCVNVSLLFQHGESAEDTVFTERAVCFRRQHCPIGLPIHAMHRHSGPRRPGMTGHPSAPQLRQPAAEPHGATPGGPRPPQHSVAPANTDHGFSVITVPSARPPC